MLHLSTIFNVKHKLTVYNEIKFNLFLMNKVII
jgi:hypothetical protein